MMFQFSTQEHREQQMVLMLCNCRDGQHWYHRYCTRSNYFPASYSVVSSFQRTVVDFTVAVKQPKAITLETLWKGNMLLNLKLCCRNAEQNTTFAVIIRFTDLQSSKLLSS